MIFDKQGNISIVTQESVSITVFRKRFLEKYNAMQHNNIILNLFSLDVLTINDLLEFLEISNKHRASKKSFVIVSGSVPYDDIPEEMMVVPTLQEAMGIVEMEEIERDLGF